jgi:hypothetical protein
MALNVLGGELEFVAQLDTTQLETNAKKAEASLTHLGDSADRTATKSQSIFSSIAGGVLALGAAEKTIEFFGDSIREALDAEDTAARFKNTLDSINRADIFDELMGAADKLQAKFRYLDNDEIVAVFNKLITYGKLTKQQIEQLTPVIIDFSAKQRISIEQGSSIIIKALEGNTRSLKEYGIELKKGATEADRLTAIMTQLKSKVDGAGEAFQNTASGGIAAAKQQMKDLEEEVGNKLIPVLSGFLKWVSGAIEGLRLIGEKAKNTFSDVLTFITKGPGAAEADIAERRVKELLDAQERVIQNHIDQFTSKSKEDIHSEIDRINQVIDAKSKNLKVLKDAKFFDSSNFTKEDQKNLEAYEQGIRVLKGELSGLLKLQDGRDDKSKLGISADEVAKVDKAKKDHSEINSLLGERKSILDAIGKLQNDSILSGLSDEDRQLKEIADRYDDVIKKVTEYNKRAPKTGAPLIDGSDLVKAKGVALSNTRLKQDADKFKQSLQEQEGIFQQFEEAKKEIGVEKAKEMFAEQTKGYTSYLQLLKSEAEKIAPKIVFGAANVGDIEKMKFLTKAINDEEEKNQKEQFAQQIENFKRLFVETASFNQRRLALEKQYNEDVVSLKKTYSGKELEERLQVLKDAKDEDLKNLGESLAAQTKGYRALHQNLVKFASDRIKAEIAALKKALENTNLDQPTKDAIKAAINAWQDLDNSINVTDDKVNKFADDCTKIAGVFSTIAGAVRGVNSNLADSLDAISSIVQGVGQARTQWNNFQKERNKLQDGTGNILDTVSAAGGLIGTVVSVISTIVNIFKQAKESARQAKAEIEDFNQKVMAGELEVTQQYRERQREQARLNELKLEGIKKENALLADQKKNVQAQYDDILRQLQAQTAVVSEEAKKTGGFLGIGRKTKVVEITQSLAGQTFDQLEALFNKGQLTGKARELFEMLQKLKQEGLDIDKQLQDLQAESAQIFTGTTADAISAAILDGFKQGKRSAADFADTFQELMQNALLSSFEAKVIEEKINDFYTQFAAAAESPGGLTQSKIDALKKQFNDTIANIGTQFDQLTKVTGISFGSTSPQAQQQNTVIGNFKAITEDTANVLAGQFGGMRVAQLQLLDVQRNALGHLHLIETNTANTVFELQKVVKVLNDSASGMRPLKVNL